LLGQRRDLGGCPHDLERDLNRSRLSDLHFDARAHRFHKREVRLRVLLDELLGAQP